MVLPGHQSAAHLRHSGEWRQLHPHEPQLPLRLHQSGQHDQRGPQSIRRGRQGEFLIVRHFGSSVKVFALYMEELVKELFKQLRNETSQSFCMRILLKRTTDNPLEPKRLFSSTYCRKAFN